MSARSAKIFHKPLLRLYEMITTDDARKLPHINYTVYSTNIIDFIFRLLNLTHTEINLFELLALDKSNYRYKYSTKSKMCLRNESKESLTRNADCA